MPREPVDPASHADPTTVSAVRGVPSRRCEVWPPFLPAGGRSAVAAAIEAGIEFLFSHDPAVADYPMGYGNTKPSAVWFKLGFPSAYGADVLQVLEVLVELGHGSDPRLVPALDWVAAQQDEQGRWLNRHAYKGKTTVDFEQQGKPSKWVTLRACTVLAAA